MYSSLVTSFYDFRGISQSNLMKVKVRAAPTGSTSNSASPPSSNPSNNRTASQRAHLAELDTLFASLQSRAFRGEL